MRGPDGRPAWIVVFSGYVYALMAFRGQSLQSGSGHTACLSGVLALVLLVSSPGCRHFPIPAWRHAKVSEVHAAYPPERGFVILEGGESAGQAVVQPDADAAVLLSLLPGGNVPLEWGTGQMPHPAGVVPREGDRCWIVTKGVHALPQGPWIRVSQDPARYTMQRDFATESRRGFGISLSLQREIRLLGKDDLAGVVPAETLGALPVSGYESQTLLTNPGPLPWGAATGLPHIQIDGDFSRGTGTIFLLHARNGSGEALVHALAGSGKGDDGLGFALLSEGSAVIGMALRPDGFLLELPIDTVLPRVALLDRSASVLTLIGFTMPAGFTGSGDTEGLRPSPQISVSRVHAGRRWYRVSTSGAVLPLARGGSTRHHRQTFHVHGPVDDLVGVAAAFCRLDVDGVSQLLERLTRGAGI